MIIYFVVFFILLFLSALFSSKKTLLYFSTSIVLILFSGLRYKVGVDYNSYNEYFNLIRITDNKPFEPLNIYIIKFIDLLGLSNYVIFFVYSAITVSGFMFFIKNFSDNFLLSLIIFYSIGIYYFATFNGIRQSVAISLFSVALVYLYREAYFKVFVFLVFACVFHFSAIILLPLIFLLLKRISFRTIIIMLLFCIFSANIILYLINLSVYNIYINGLFFDNRMNMSFFYSYVFLLLFLYFFYINKKKMINKKYLILNNISILSFFSIFIGLYLDISYLTFMRINAYFQLQLIILIPSLSLFLPKKHQNLFKFAIVMFCFAYLIRLICFNGENNSLTPYMMVPINDSF